MHAHVRTNTPTIFVVFGITGDLAHTKIIPALFALYKKSQLPDQFRIIGFARRDLPHDVIRASLGAHITGEDRDAFLEKIFYHQGYFNDTARYKALEEYIQTFENEFGVCTNKILYLSVHPSHYTEVIAHMGETKLAHECSDTDGWTRVLIEKPYGEDSESARLLDHKVHSVFKEEQVFRVDHYLGKEEVREIEGVRFAQDAKREWNNRSVARITMRLLETKDVDTRGAFYDAVGTLNDVGQNHMLETLAHTMMQKPQKGAAHAARSAILAKLQFKSAITRGQYEGFRDVQGVSLDSDTETFFHIVGEVADSKWQGVPIHMIAGKALDRSEVSIEVVYTNNDIDTFVIQPRRDVQTQAYENVLFDATIGEREYFVSLEEVVHAWDFVAAAKRGLLELPLELYKKGTRMDKEKPAT